MVAWGGYGDFASRCYRGQGMNWIDAIVAIILIAGIFGGLKDGTFKSVGGLVAILIAIPLAGLSYRLPAWALSFLPGTAWENFLGFGIAFGLIGWLLKIPLNIERWLTGEKRQSKGPLNRAIGGAANLISSGIGVLLFALTVAAFPVFGWLYNAIVDSRLVTSLEARLSFVLSMLPEVFKTAAEAIRLGS